MTGIRILLTGFLVAVLTSLCSAEELPLWEAGLGATGLRIPDYRGSDESRDYFLPMPYLTYRGDILRIDRKGMYGLLFQSERVELNISADAGVPVESEKNHTRFGMPDLDPSVQLGPSLEVCLYRTCAKELVAQFRLPIRAVWVTDFSRITNIGFVVNPQINIDFNDIGPGGGWDFGVALGPIFATEQYHDYYYQVSPQYSLAGSRPSYDAKSGYSGSLLILSLSKRFEHLWCGAFARYDDLSDAVFNDSPLMKSNRSFMAGFGFAWVFGQSSLLVNVDP